MVKPKFHILVCSSSRLNGVQKGYCIQNGGSEIVETIIEEVDDRDLSSEIMVTNTGCLSICDKGPIVIIYPEGIWYGNVSSDDIEEIFDSHIENGKVVERLLI
ncbi:MAG: hypothetical protein PWP46_944 [Fusobacteriaceae bacterium]|jgi:(2Fe-2S) ferredoxin|nr:Sucraseferredoxin family protein [Fusobacteriales bacterium]MDN5304065.1 hypothetical protein [Fusobacteriaceae bacterium]